MVFTTGTNTTGTTKSGFLGTLLVNAAAKRTMSKIIKAIDELAESLEGKTVTTDLAAELRNFIKEATDKLERISFKTGDDYILLKWGSLKGWELHSAKGKNLSDDYINNGRSMSAMLQKDNAHQKELILEMIEECNGTIQNDWDGSYYTKQQARDYITSYSE